MKKVYLACILLTVMLIRIYPQSVTKESLFSDLDTTRLSSGILYNLFVNKDLYARFDGINDTVCSTSEKWFTLYRELYCANLKSTGLPTSMDLFDSISSKINLQKVPIGLINRKCDSIKNYAFTNDLLRFDNNKIYDGDNYSETPYLNIRCFSASVLTDNIYSKNVNYTFSNQFIFIDPNENINYLKVDFGDGNGLITISENEEKTVTYADYGLKNIIIEEHTNNGIYKCITKLMLKTPLVDLRSTDYYTSDSLRIQGTYNNKPYKGSYKIWYGANNDGPNTLKPIILVEGFDPYNDNNFDKLFAYGNNKYLLDNLINQGFDIVILNFDDATIKIQANAMVLEALINHINSTKTTNNELVIIGASMGGLVARYALSHMESQNVNHHTRLFLSIDTPHDGAYLPLSTQYTISQLRKACNTTPIIKDKLFTKINPYYKLLNSDASKQMLTYHYNSCNTTIIGAGKILEPDQLHLDLFGGEWIPGEGNSGTYSLGEFKTLTSSGFPQNCKNIALSCGSGTGNPQNGHAIDNNTPYVDVTNAITENVQLTLKMVPLTTIYESPNTIFYINAWFGQRITSSIFLPIFQDPNLSDFRVNVACCNWPYDGAPGGNYQLIHDLCDALKSSIHLNVSFSGSDCFVPSTSALSLSCSLYDDIHTTFGFSGDSLEVENYFPPTHSPVVFDAMYIESANLPHITKPNSITEGMRDWMISQITQEELFFQNKIISEATKRYESYKTIIAGNNVTSGQVGNVVIQNNSDIKFVAGEKIKLGPGFEVKLGSKFKAVVKH